MKIGLLADIHSNLQALEAVVKEARAEMIEHFVVAGDFIGYYLYPSEVIDLVSNLPLSAVKGNHEELLSSVVDGKKNLEEINILQQAGVEKAIKTFQARHYDFIRSLVHPNIVLLGGRRVLVCHGHPRDIDKYVYPNQLDSFCAEEFLEDFDLVVMGHTHYPALQNCYGGTVVVNPGSVGQQRSGVLGAHWATYNCITAEVEFKTTEYDICSVQSELSKVLPEEAHYLVDVLGREK